MDNCSRVKAAMIEAAKVELDKIAAEDPNVDICYEHWNDGDKTFSVFDFDANVELVVEFKREEA